jgi:hypothetical protein
VKKEECAGQAGSTEGRHSQFLRKRNPRGRINTPGASLYARRRAFALAPA